MTPEDSDVARLVRQVCRLFDLDEAKLGDEFFPAHLSIALIDAIFTPRIRYCQQVVPVIRRYCVRFNLCRVCPDRTKLPPVDEQETLTDLIDHYKALGPGGFQNEIVRSRYCSPRNHNIEVRERKAGSDRIARNRDRKRSRMHNKKMTIRSSACSDVYLESRTEPSTCS